MADDATPRRLSGEQRLWHAVVRRAVIEYLALPRGCARRGQPERRPSENRQSMTGARRPGPKPRDERHLSPWKYLFGSGGTLPTTADLVGIDIEVLRRRVRRARRRLLSRACLMGIVFMTALPGFGGTITGTLQTPGGLPVANGTLAFTLRQAGLAIGSGGVVPVTSDCYTSTDGSIVGLPNPTASVESAIGYGSGSLPAGIYYVEVTFYAGSPSAQESLPSPEARIQLTGAGTLAVSAPASWPANAAGMRVYIGMSSGGETLQGQTTGAGSQYSQSSPLAAGAAPPSTNNSICSIAFNDTIIPYTGYDVSLTSANGNSYPGWPQAWQLNGGANGTVNVSEGAPLWNGTVIYPQPIMAQPLNHGPQSISGPLNLNGYNLANAGAIGVGTSTPSWPVDVEDGASGFVNASGGYLAGGSGGTAGQCLVSNGTAFLPGACYTAPPVYYQKLELGGASQPQEPAIDFSSAFTLGDAAGSATNVDLANSGVEAGSYTDASITVNAKGQVTAASSGVAPGGTDDYFTFQGCSITSGSNPNTCNGSVNFTSGGNTNPSFPAMPDGSYFVTCTPETGNEYGTGFSLSAAPTITGFSYVFTVISPIGNQPMTPTFYCHLHHD